MPLHGIMPAAASISLVGGAAVVAPAAQAATTYVTAYSAGTKAVGATTYLWGTSDAPAGTTVCSQVSLSGRWSTSQCSTVKSDRSYAVELTYGKSAAGTYTFHAVTRDGTGAISATSPSVTLTRIGTSTTTATSTRFTTSKVNVRSAASTSASIVGTLAAGTKVTGTISGSWLKIMTPSTSAGRYVSTTVLSSSAPAGSSTTSPSTIDYVKGRTTAGYVLAAGYNGTKVDLVQKALGVASGPTYTTMGPQTMQAVSTFQRAHTGLRTDGVVDADTYYAIKDTATATAEIRKYDFDVDMWMAPSAVAAGATRDARVTAMIGFATDQLGKPYVWGGTGPLGYDCSGLMIQALRAGGYAPKNVNNLVNVRPESDLSHQMWLDPEFPRGSLSSPQRGDLVYFGDSNGRVRHVSMYVGGTTYINAVGTKVQYSDDQIAQYARWKWGKVIGINRMP